MIMVRYADDIVVGFEHQADAERFWEDDAERLAGVCSDAASGEDAPDRVRPLCGGEPRESVVLGKPETFNFLGLHATSAGRTAGQDFQLKRKTRRDRMRAKLQEIKEALRRRMHQTIEEQGDWLRQVVTGYFAYHAVPTNSRRWRRSDTTSSISGGARFGGAARRAGDMGADGEAGRRLAPTAAYPASLAQRTLRRQTPEVGAVCGNSARPDLCGLRLESAWNHVA